MSYASKVFNLNMRSLAMDRRVRLSSQLDAVAYINLARRIYSYSFRKLSELLNIPESSLCRYANMEVLPSVKVADKIISTLRPMLDIVPVVKRLVRINGSYIDLSGIILDPNVLKLYEMHIAELFEGLKVTKVLTAAVDGIPLAVAASYALGARLIVAKQYMEAGFDQFYSSSYIVDSPPRKVTLYVPKPLIGRGDSVIIVDDIVRTGRTIDALLDIIRQSGASLVGMSILVAVGSDVVSRLRRAVGNIILDIIAVV